MLSSEIHYEVRRSVATVGLFISLAVLTGFGAAGLAITVDHWMDETPGVTIKDQSRLLPQYVGECGL
ncbi:MAG: hypothetical protein AAFO61_04905 [Pseudomonadota bacterium]